MVLPKVRFVHAHLVSWFDGDGFGLVAGQSRDPYKCPTILMIVCLALTFCPLWDSFTKAPSITVDMCLGSQWGQAASSWDVSQIIGHYLVWKDKVIPDVVRSELACLIPSRVKQLQAFGELLGYCRAFVPFGIGIAHSSCVFTVWKIPGTGLQRQNWLLKLQMDPCRTCHDPAWLWELDVCVTWTFLGGHYGRNQKACSKSLYVPVIWIDRSTVKGLFYIWTKFKLCGTN